MSIPTPLSTEALQELHRQADAMSKTPKYCEPMKKLVDATKACELLRVEGPILAGVPHYLVFGRTNTYQVTDDGCNCVHSKYNPQERYGCWHDVAVELYKRWVRALQPLTLPLGPSTPDERLAQLPPEDAPQSTMTPEPISQSTLEPEQPLEDARGLKREGQEEPAMSTAVMELPRARVSQPPMEPSWTEDQLALMKKTVAQGATDDELALFLYTAKRTGLDPLARQIYCIKRGGRMTIQTAIDGYRLIADRTGVYAGSADAVYDSEDTDHPGKATVTVYKLVGGQARAFTASARWKEYAQTFQGKLGDLWQRMPYTMLSKCAESLALRKAFPQELSGVYTHEEMTQAGRIDTQDDAALSA